MKRLFILVILCFFSVSIFAQRGDNRTREDFEKFKAKRMEYISSEMDLNSEDSKAFWPICDELQRKKFELNKTLRQEIRKIHEKEKSGNKPSQAEYEKLINISLDIKVKEAKLEQEYYNKFKKIITSEQIYKYQRSEMRFARQMLDGDNIRRNNDIEKPKASDKKKDNRKR